VFIPIKFKINNYLMWVGNGTDTEYKKTEYQFLHCLHEINVSTKPIDLLNK